MNSFVETLSPAARNHAEARIDYYTDLTQAVLVTLRQLTEANVQFSRSWLDDSTAALRNALLTPPGERAAEQAAGAASGASAAAQKLQAYQQQLAQVATNFQASISELTQQHAPETARTARALAGAGQQAAGKHLFDEASRFANLAAQNQAMPQAASMQNADGSGNKN